MRTSLVRGFRTVAGDQPTVIDTCPAGGAAASSCHAWSRQVRPSAETTEIPMLVAWATAQAAAARADVAGSRPSTEEATVAVLPSSDTETTFMPPSSAFKA